MNVGDLVDVIFSEVEGVMTDFVVWLSQALFQETFPQTCKFEDGILARELFSVLRGRQIK